MAIEKLRPHRWLIWTIVLMLVIGIGCATFVWYSSETGDENNQSFFLVHHPKNAPAANTASSRAK